MSDIIYVWCHECKNNFPIREEINDDLEEYGSTFYCPKGHALAFSRKVIVSDLRRVKRALTYKNSLIDKLEKRGESFKGVITRYRNRLLRGACPYCNKTPSDMIKHINEKHGPKA